jgi:hypothetical protein
MVVSKHRGGIGPYTLRTVVRASGPLDKQLPDPA